MSAPPPPRTWGFTPLVRLPAFAVVIPISFVQVVGTVPAAFARDELDRVNALTIALALGAGLCLLMRRNRPFLTLLATVAICVLYLVLRYPPGPIFISPLVAAFSAVLYGPRLLAWGSSVVSLGIVLTVMDLVRDDYQAGYAEVGFGVAWLTLILMLAETVRVRQERAAQAAQAADEQNKRRASDERLRIAREVHDVLAHHVSLINVQSGVALHLIDEQPEQARQALSAIKQSSKEVLVELRNILGVLKNVDENAPRQPVASLDQLDRLLERMREAGLPVDLEVSGERRTLPSGVDAAALRIVQESLTNTYRHAGPTQATVRLDYLPDRLEVTVDDNGRGEAGGAVPGLSVGTGSGLTGMRQRAEALGGTLTAGPRPGGGFRVAATLPTGSTGGTEDGS